MDVFAWTWNGGKDELMNMVTPDWETQPMATSVSLTKYGADVMYYLMTTNDNNESILE